MTVRPSHPKMQRSTITANEADRFNRTAGERERLWCSQPTGLYLLKLKQGCSWRVKYRDVSAKQRETTIGRYPEMAPKDAKQTATHIINNIQQVDPLLEKRAKRIAALNEQAQTVSAFLEGPYTAFQSRKKNQGRHTINLIKSNFAGLLDRPMASLTKADIRRWQGEREKLNLQHTTLVRAYGALKAMLNRAQLDEIIAANPLREVSLDAPVAGTDAPSIERRLLLDREIQGLALGLATFNDQKKTERRNSRAHGKPYLPDLDCTDYAHWFIPFCHAALHLGMRPGDLYALEWTHISFLFKRLIKTPEKTRHYRSPQQLDLPLNDTILEILEAWNRQQGGSTTGLVFPSQITDQQLDRNAHLRHWGRVKSLSGELSENLHFYALRHNFISTLVSNGIPMLTVAKLAGHKGTKMIENHYGHLCPAKAAEAMQAFGRTLTGKETDDVSNVY